MEEIEHFFLLLTIVGFVGGLVLKPYFWPEGDVVEGVAVVILGSSVVSFNILVLYGLIPDTMKQNIFIKIACFIFPVLGSVSCMRFMTNWRQN